MSGDFVNIRIIIWHIIIGPDEWPRILKKNSYWIGRWHKNPIEINKFDIFGCIGFLLKKLNQARRTAP